MTNGFGKRLVVRLLLTILLTFTVLGTLGSGYAGYLLASPNVCLSQVEKQQAAAKNQRLMKGLSYSFLRAICALVIGLVLVMFPDQAGDYFVITIGVIFLVPSLISIIGYYAQAAEVRRRFPVEGVGSLLFGLWLIIMPGFFADLLTFVLGFILVMGGVQQIASLSAARRWTPVPGGFYVVPVLILLAGLIALFNPTGVRSTAFIIIGITSLVYAVSELINWFKFTRLRPKAPVAGDKTSDVDIEDAKIIE